MMQRQVSFQEAVVRAVKDNYCNFSGRASRSEFWWFALFTAILNFVINIVFSFSDTMPMIVSGIVGLALMLPNLGLAVRRLHDIGKSGWWIFIQLIPLVGLIIYIVWVCKESYPAENEYGQVPNLV